MGQLIVRLKAATQTLVLRLLEVTTAPNARCSHYPSLNGNHSKCPSGRSSLCPPPAALRGEVTPGKRHGRWGAGWCSLPHPSQAPGTLCWWPVRNWAQVNKSLHSCNGESGQPHLLSLVWSHQEKLLEDAGGSFYPTRPSPWASPGVRQRRFSCILFCFSLVWFQCLFNVSNWSIFWIKGTFAIYWHL